jgi:hypothetical protein
MGREARTAAVRLVIYIAGSLHFAKGEQGRKDQVSDDSVTYEQRDASSKEVGGNSITRDNNDTLTDEDA